MPPIDKSRVEPPAVIYKYYSSDSALKVLSSSSIKMEILSNYNDCMELMPQWDSHKTMPFVKPSIVDNSISDLKDMGNVSDENIFHECMKNICKLYKKTYPPIDDRNAQDKFLKAPENFFIMSEFVKRCCLCSCFSAERNINLMWAHYACNHAGVCFGFNTQSFRNKKIIKIKYQTKRICMKANPSTLELEGSHESAYTKGIDWKYEQEWRINYGFERPIILLSDVLLRKYGITKNTDGNIYLKKFNLPDIKEVCFGINASSDTKNAIKNELADLKNIKYYQMRPHPEKFELLAIHLNN